MIGREVVKMEEIPDCFKRKRAQSEHSSDESEREEKRSWLGSERVRRSDKERRISMFELPSENEEEEIQTVSGRERPKCPVFGCEVKTKRIRNHVNRLDLPKLLWDNHSPPVKEDKVDEFNRLRHDVLVFFAEKLVGSRDIFQLVKWCDRNRVIPQRSIATRRQIEQMRSLSATMMWRRPSYNRYTLYPPNHCSVLIHRRYIVGMLQRLTKEDTSSFMDFVISFMYDPDNFTPLTNPDGEGATILSRSLTQRVSEAGQSTWDESRDLVVQARVSQMGEKVIPVDECGEPDDMQPQPESPTEDTRTVIRIGDHNYTLVIRGTSLQMSRDNHRRPSSFAVCPAPTVPLEDKWEAFDVYDSHFHLDRTSKKLLGDYSLTMDNWWQEPMERPSRIPVNIIGGTLIFCDPYTYPTSIPIEDKWRVAVGIHPKLVRSLTGTQLTYLVILKLCTEFFPSSQKFILHCFTGTRENVDAWLTHFPDTFLGLLGW